MWYRIDKKAMINLDMVEQIRIEKISTKKDGVKYTARLRLIGFHSDIRIDIETREEAEKELQFIADNLNIMPV